jgi:outer membrane lipoprotein-sorting protein
MNWTFPTTIADDTFTFAPPADAHKIVMATLVAANAKGVRP